jgi:uncharacterized protein
MASLLTTRDGLSILPRLVVAAGKIYTSRCTVKIFLTGGTGFLGTYLHKFLARQGHEITLLVRSNCEAISVEGGVHVVMGDPTRRGDWQNHLAGQDTIINLAGAPIFRRWTETVKKAIFESRIRSTENIVEAVRSTRGSRVDLFNASGVGYYGYCSDRIITEEEPPGATFLAELARTWEATALCAEESGIRVVLCRLGIVLGREGGAFRQLLPLVKFHLGAPWAAADNGSPGSMKGMWPIFSLSSLNIRTSEGR